MNRQITAACVSLVSAAYAGDCNVLHMADALK